MSPEQFRRLTAAPEILVVDLVDAALVALDLALLVEYPLRGSDDAAPDGNVSGRLGLTVSLRK